MEPFACPVRKAGCSSPWPHRPSHSRVDISSASQLRARAFAPGKTLPLELPKFRCYQNEADRNNGKITR
ncbi:hypothetical protein Pan216_39570 [Planctomycetes bacterium Pan216]|uniref:Uncharacterized protein n=1 Tax=Kolteria novifilia TaxID=2527975 RepID=A0A518B812_9BACT|nr:hypothetical protein Pan216_39570 [Planctomycetes bacterium Pan216]